MDTYRVTISVTVDVAANNESDAEVIALEFLGLSKADVTDITLLNDKDQQELFDEA